jgi:hypothetical protein
MTPEIILLLLIGVGGILGGLILRKFFKDIEKDI